MSGLQKIIALLCIALLVVGLFVLLSIITPLVDRDLNPVAAEASPALGDELLFPDGWELAAVWLPYGTNRPVYICRRGGHYRECTPVRKVTK